MELELGLKLIAGIVVASVVYGWVNTRLHPPMPKSTSPFMSGVKYAEVRLGSLKANDYTVAELERDIDQARAFDEYTDFDKGIESYICFYKNRLASVQ